MNRDLKNALKKSFEAPPPMKKEVFLRSVQTPSISLWEFVRSQVAYIRKWIWGLSILIFAIALVGSEWIERDVLWCVSAFMPLLALGILTESSRAEAYGMAEFELSTRFSLKSVVLARLGIIGIANIILMCLVTPFIVMNSDVTVLQTGVYMTCPYLLTTFLGLWAVRNVRGKEGLYLCAGIAVTVSIGNIAIFQTLPIFYQGHNLIWWIIAVAILGVGTTSQCCQMVKQTEELAWNL